MDLSMYSISDLQVVDALLSQAAASGISETVSVRSMLRDKLEPARKPSLVHQTIERKVCPSCSRGVIMNLIHREGVVYLACRACRYSEII